jgi:hypothetical protein
MHPFYIFKNQLFYYFIIIYLLYIYLAYQEFMG